MCAKHTGSSETHRSLLLPAAQHLAACCGSLRRGASGWLNGMTDTTVHRHGDRWAVREAGAESPVKEFPTREAAELAASQMAGGGTV